MKIITIKHLADGKAFYRRVLVWILQYVSFSAIKFGRKAHPTPTLQVGN